MRIKRLELQGFKSFKDKTVINFDAGITGIVGPNGCGKSNVVDAFFWALGEMNPRNLRGQNMDDLIFSGSDHAPASNVAEVNLILDVPADLSGPNAPAGASFKDLSTIPLMREVAVSRRLYRNGESEYFINKVACRLKDIQELFMDTGAGARGYSIIQQGKIAEIVNAKPDERRTMIEDVAGVMKYKTRRREAQRKLESTTQNLLRVSDILTEIDGRRKQTERQAEKAKRYREWKAELQTSELGLSAIQWEEEQENLGALDKELETLEAIDAAAIAERDTSDNQIQQKRLETVSATKINEELQAKWIRESQELNAAETSLSYQTKTADDLTNSLEAIEQEANQERERVESLLLEFSAAEEQNSSLESSLSQAQKLRAETEAEAEARRVKLEASEAASEASQEALLRNTTETTKLEERERGLENRLRELGIRLSEIETSRSALLSEKEAFVLETEEAEATVEKLRSDLSSAKDELEATIRSLSETRKEADQARRNLSEAEASHLRLISSHRALEDQKRRFEGSALGVQTLFQKLLPKADLAQQDLIKGTLASGLKVAPGYETAVESLLGPMLEAVLTLDSYSARDFSTSLAELGSGRATFADLSALANNSISTQALDGRKSLLSFVELTQELATLPGSDNLLKKLIGNAFLTDSISEAQALARDNPDLIFLTKAGEICRGGCFLTGGAPDSNGSLVSRNRALEELKEKIALAESEKSAAEQNLANLLAQVANIESKRAEIEILHEETRRACNDAESRVSILASNSRQAGNALDAVEREVVRSNAERDSLQEQATDARAKLEDLRAEGISLNSTWKEASTSLPELRRSAEEIRAKLLDARVAEASVAEQRNSVESNLRNAKQNLSRAEQRIESLLKQAAEKRALALTTNEEISRLQDLITEHRMMIVTSEAAFREARDSLDRLNSELEACRSRSEAASRHERETKEKIGSIKLSIERLQFERTNLAQNALDRYGIELSDYVASTEVRDQILLLKAKGPEARKELESDVLRLREKIRKLGEVNSAAIEEFEELTTRFQFLSEQKADLEKSMADLQSTIDKINRISKERFFRAFEEVNKQFTQVFPALFGGGQAALTLTSPDDFNETGVDIMAQPPGKKLQNINLLSGGEKTLTAISLLFAIFLVKPSPFCLLDEVDAPLDDANIGRFNALLREMARQSQFIIITHNKRTMELNDKLYGVTMEDAGVSKMVSIQLAG